MVLQGREVVLVLDVECIFFNFNDLLEGSCVGVGVVVSSDNNGVDASFSRGCNSGSEAKEAVASSDVVCRLAFSNIFRRSWFGEGNIWTLGSGASVHNKSPKM